MIYEVPPDGFQPKFEVVSCYVEHEGKLLLLHRCAHKIEGNTWGVPAGKVVIGEDISQAMLRELREETGIVASKVSMEHLIKVFVRYPTYDFTYHMFRLPVVDRPTIRLAPAEHQDYTWATPAHALSMNLIRDLDACIRMFYP